MNEISINLPITEATIYPRSAKVKRSEKVNLKSTLNKIIISDLPQNLSADTIRVNLQENSALKIIDIFTEDIFKEEYNDNLYIRQQKELKELLFQNTKLEALLNNLSEEFLIFYNKQTFTSQLKEDFNSPIKSSSWKEFLDFLNKKLKDNRKKSQDIIFKWLTLQNKIEVAKENLAKYAPYNKKKEHRVSILIEAPQDLTERIEVEYIQSGVSWYPSYTMRVDTQAKRINISMFAMLKQTTGQNWKNVKLLFSTAMPMQNCSIPNLKSKIIQEKEPQINQIPFPIMEQQMMEQQTSKFIPMQSSMGKMAGGLEQDLEIEEKIDQPSIETKNETKKMKRQKRMLDIKLKKSYKKSNKSQYLSKKVYNQQLTEKMSQDFEQEEKINIDAHQSNIVKTLSTINTIINSIDQKYSFALSLTNFSHYYSLLYEYLHTKFDPEQLIDKSTKQSVIDFFLQEVPLTQSLGGYDYRYSVESITNNIPSIDTPNLVDITTMEFPIEFSFVTIPIEQEQVYLRGRFKNRDNRPIPSGPTQIFIENNFLGNLIFPNLSENEETFLSLGVERNIKVNRKENVLKKTTGFVGNSIIAEYVIEIEIINFLEQEITIDVFDRIPISDKKNIEIQDIRYDQQPTKITKRNILLWKLKINSQERKKIKFYYSVKHPENFQLSMYNAETPYIVE